MPVLEVSGGGFAVHQRGVIDASPFVYTSSAITQSERPHPLLVVADVLEAVPGATDVAAGVVRGVAAYLHNAPGTDPVESLNRAFANANERIVAENRERAGGRRLYIGLTAVLLDGDEIYIAQAAPSQTLVWQEGELYSIPSLTTWSARDVTGTFTALDYPLGFRSEHQPRISYSRCVPGDVVAVLSWQLARKMVDSGLLSGDSGAGEFRSALAELRLDSRAREYHGAVCRISGEEVRDHRGSRRHFTDSGGRRGPDFDRLGQDNETHDETIQLRVAGSQSGVHPARTRHACQDTWLQVEQEPGSYDRHPDRPGSGTYSIAQSAGANAASESRRHARKGRTVELFAGLLLSLSAAVVGVWQITKRDRPIHGPRDDGTLGLPHLQRWSDTYQPPRFDRVRRVSPRFQISGFLLVGVVVAVVALAAVLVFNRLDDRAAGTNAGIQERLQEITTIRSQTDLNSPSESSYESLSSALLVLDDLEASAPSEDVQGLVAEERAAVETAIAQLTQAERLGNVQVMGSIPSAPEGVTQRMFSGNGTIYLLSDALYELNPLSNSLVLLLQPGDLVGGEPVGTLVAGSWNQDRPVVVDSHNAYMREPSDGRWHRVPLGTVSEAGFTGVTAAMAFDRNLYYLMSESGQIFKFDALDFGATPEDWAAGSARELLHDAVDIYIDGSIHVALHDGTVLTFFRSAHDRTLKAEVIPPLESVSALTTVAGGQYFYMVDSASGRIVGMSTGGELFRQYLPRDGGIQFHGATDLVVDESSGVTYVVANSTLYAVRVGLPGR